jgi:selenocysteine-specific elongation factor
VITDAGLNRARERVAKVVRSFLDRKPLARGISREEARSQLGYERGIFNALLNQFLIEGVLTEVSGVISLPDWSPKLSRQQEEQAEAFLTLLRASPYSPSTENRPDNSLLAYLINRGAVVDVGGGIVLAREAFDTMVDSVAAALQSKGSISLPEVRDLFSTSRRYAQHFLEYLDSKRITRRRGDERVAGPALDTALDRVKDNSQSHVLRLGDQGTVEPASDS